MTNISEGVTVKKSPITSIVAVAALLGALLLTSAHAQDFSPDQLQRRTLERRAVEAAIWGMPIVSFDAMRQAYFRDAKANYNDVAFLSEFSDWKFLITTPNNSTGSMQTCGVHYAANATTSSPFAGRKPG
jgi:hypothetical protein